MEAAQRRVLAIAWPPVCAQRGRGARIVGLSLLGGLIAVLQPLLSKVLIDEGALAGDMRVLAAACGALLLTPLLGLALEAANRRDYLEFSSRVLFHLRERVFEHLQSLSPHYYSRVGFGDLTARFDGDLAEVQRFVVDAPLALIGGLFNLALLTALMFWLHPLLALVVLATIPPQIAATWWRRRAIETTTRAVREEATAVSNYFLDSLRAVKFIQATNTEQTRLDGLRARHDAYRGTLHDAREAGFIVGALQRVAGTVALGLTIAVGAWLLMRGQTSVGVLVAFVAYAARAAGPVNTLLGVYSGWRRARVSLSRVAELIDAPAMRREASAALPRERGGRIEFRSVSYGHAADAPVLREASFTVAAGEKVALIGASGGGKSTIADLLRGYFSPQAGTILIDGVDIGRVALAELRRRVAVVDQEPVFFPGTVADNLRYVKPEADDAELSAALRRAGFSDEGLLARPMGAVSQTLSRGERMRLALARALLLDPAILVLDEATSAVDTGAALAIMSSVDAWFAGRTRLVVVHDLALAGPVDRVLRLNDGCFDADGEAVADGARRSGR